MKSLTYFLQRGIRFEYEPSNPGIPVVFGPLQDTALRAELNEAIDARRDLSKQAKRHQGDCNKDGVKGNGETFCTTCRLTDGVCLFCSSEGLTPGELDCPLCRIVVARTLRQKVAKI